MCRERARDAEKDVHEARKMLEAEKKAKEEAVSELGELKTTRDHLINKCTAYENRINKLEKELADAQAKKENKENRNEETAEKSEESSSDESSGAPNLGLANIAGAFAYVAMQAPAPQVHQMPAMFVQPNIALPVRAVTTYSMRYPERATHDATIDRIRMSQAPQKLFKRAGLR